ELGVGAAPPRVWTILHRTRLGILALPGPARRSRAQPRSDRYGSTTGRFATATCTRPATPSRGATPRGRGAGRARLLFGPAPGTSPGTRPPPGGRRGGPGGRR